MDRLYPLARPFNQACSNFLVLTRKRVWRGGEAEKRANQTGRTAGLERPLNGQNLSVYCIFDAACRLIVEKRFTPRSSSQFCEYTRNKSLPGLRIQRNRDCQPRTELTVSN